MTWGFVTCGPNEALVVSGERRKQFAKRHWVARKKSIVARTQNWYRVGWHGAPFPKRRERSESLMRADKLHNFFGSFILDEFRITWLVWVCDNNSCIMRQLPFHHRFSAHRNKTHFTTYLSLLGCCYMKPLLVPGGRAFVWPSIQRVQR